MASEEKRRVVKLNPNKKNGKGVELPSDSGYLRWIRLGANDKQILALRDEIREHRTVCPENVHTNEKLKQEFMVLLRMLSLQLWDNVPGDDEGNEGVLIEETVTEDDLNELGRKNISLDISVTEDKTAWVLTLSRDSKGES